jgi:2'-5' RNA ligase
MLPEFNLTLEKTGIFGSKYDPRVIWFGIKDMSIN